MIEIIILEIDEFIFKCSSNPSFILLGRHDLKELKSTLGICSGCDFNRCFGLEIIEVDNDFWLEIN